MNQHMNDLASNVSLFVLQRKYEIHVSMLKFQFLRLVIRKESHLSFDQNWFWPQTGSHVIGLHFVYTPLFQMVVNTFLAYEILLNITSN